MLYLEWKKFEARENSGFALEFSLIQRRIDFFFWKKKKNLLASKTASISIEMLRGKEKQNATLAYISVILNIVSAQLV